MACDAALVVLAYGKPPPRFRPRSLAVVGLLRAAGVRLTYLRASLDGTPQHPLYLPASVIPLDFQPPSSDPGLNRCHEADRQMVQDAMLSKVVSSANSMPAPTA